MKVKLDRTMCDGFGVCAKHAPGYFSLDDWGYASLVGNGDVAEADEDAVTRALLDCPVHAIVAMGEHPPSRQGRQSVGSASSAEPYPITEDSEAISEFVR